MEVLLKIKNATPGNIKSKLNKALKRLGTDFRIARSISHTTNTDQKQVTVKLKDFTHENADYKVIKALAGVGKALNCDFICKSIYNESDHPRSENGRFIEKTDISTPNNEAICQTLKNNIAPMPIEIPFTRENYDKLFKNGIETPIGHVKLGENQYDKLKDKDLGSRQRILAPMYETLKNPALIIETKDNAKLFCKEFRRPDGSDKLMVSVVIDRNNLLISISTHIERLSQVQKKCRTILYKKNPNGNVGYTHHNDMSRNSSIPKPINKSINHAEKPSYQALQDIIDNSNAEVEKIKRQAYNFICKFLGLPKINKINKSITDELTVNGKIIFDPLYGKPLKQKDFVQMINRLENFLSRRLAESERRLLLQSTALGHLIALSKNGQTQLLLETVKLKNIVHKGKSFEQLCTDYETLKHNFDKVTDNEIAKLQFIEDKIGVYVTSAKDATIKIIKDIYYDAIINHKSKQKISQEMYDQLGFLNRSWDTIARTESNNLKNHAFIVGSLNDEGKTYFRRRVGSYNTCKICASHRDKIALWTDSPLPDDTINDELADIAIWSGKSNIGRNQKDWWIPEGSTHPNCFCEWEKLLDEEVKYFRKSIDIAKAKNQKLSEAMMGNQNAKKDKNAKKEKKEKKSQKDEKCNECKNDFLKVSPSNAKNIGKKILKEWKKANPNGIKSKPLNKNVKIEGISFSHLFEHRVKGQMEPRVPAEIARRVSCLPIAKEIIEDKGVLVETRKTDGFVYETLRGRKNGKFIDVVVSTDKRNNTVYISVFPRDNIKKSVSTACDFRGDFHQASLQAPKKSASPDCHLGSSFTRQAFSYKMHGNYYTDDTVEDNIAEVIEMSSYWRKLNRH